MVHLENVSAAMMLQFGALCFLAAVLYTGLLEGEGAWERLDAVRSEIEASRSADEPSDDPAAAPLVR